MLNSRILKGTRKNKATILNIGTPGDLTYPFEHLGSTAEILDQIISGNHSACEKIKNAKFPLMVVGRDALTRNDG